VAASFFHLYPLTPNSIRMVRSNGSPAFPTTATHERNFAWNQGITVD
jgi:hypothetical protein